MSPQGEKSALIQVLYLADWASVPSRGVTITTPSRIYATRRVSPLIITPRRALRANLAGRVGHRAHDRAAPGHERLELRDRRPSQDGDEELSFERVVHAGSGEDGLGEVWLAAGGGGQGRRIVRRQDAGGGRISSGQAREEAIRRTRAERRPTP